MKIVHLLLTKRFAGSERYAVELANLQAEAGHDVTIILHHHAREARPDATAQHLSPSVRILTVSNSRLLALWQARRLLQGLQPDVSHAHLSWACRVLKGMGRKAGLRVATLHISYKPAQHASLDALIAIAPWQLAALPPSLAARTVQIDNWTLPVSPTANARQELRSNLGIEDDAVVFGTLGRLEHSKGLDVVIEAFRRAALPGARLVLVGDGKVRPALQASAGPNVHFVGYSARPRDWLEVFDVFVSAARSEPFGLVFLEAMQAGLPIIATASEGARHLQAVIAAPLVPIDDVDALSRAFASALAHRPQRRSYELQRFEARARSADITAFYQRCLATMQPA